MKYSLVIIGLLISFNFAHATSTYIRCLTTITESNSEKFDAASAPVIGTMDISKYSEPNTNFMGLTAVSDMQGNDQYIKAAVDDLATDTEVDFILTKKDRNTGTLSSDIITLQLPMASGARANIEFDAQNMLQGLIMKLKFECERKFLKQ